jgi:type II secretory pathway component GspD/PulD (secretin)
VIFSPATWQDGYAAIRPPLAAGLPLRRDPNLGPPAGKKPRAAWVPEPVPATRLDVPLKFSARPLRLVCEALAAAHGVRFEIDPAVDPRTTVTANLSGKNLKDALAQVSRSTGLKINRKDDTLYRVVPVAGGEPMAEKPIHEEALTAGENRP